MLALVDATAGKHGNETERPAEKNYYSDYTGKDAEQNDRRRSVCVRGGGRDGKCTGDWRRTMLAELQADSGTNEIPRNRKKWISKNEIRRIVTAPLM